MGKGVEVRKVPKNAVTYDKSCIFVYPMPRTLEHKIRLNAILICLVVSLICLGIVAYTYYIKADVKEQKERVSLYYTELLLANRMIEKVNQAQIEVNRYVSTRQTKHYRAFQKTLTDVETLVDSLRVSASDSTQYQLLQEIKELLKKKGQIILQLNRHLTTAGTSGKVEELMEQYTPAMQEVVVSSVVEDTLVMPVPKKGFWRKLSGLFSSESDTVMVRSVIRSDTIKVMKPDSVYLASEVSGIVEKVEEEYKNRLHNIEQQMNKLINADHEISTTIYSTLIRFYDNVLYNRWTEVQRSDSLISENSKYSMISGGIALILVGLFVLLIFQDVSRAYKMRKLLEEANKRTEDLMKSRHQLLLSVSHDVKTPLNSILGTLELKESGGRFTPTEIHSMEHAGKHILTLLENLLNFSALEQGHLKKEEQKFFLHDFCEEICDMFHPLLTQKGLDFKTDFDFPKDICLQADELRIKQVLINVLSNAIKYTHEGRVELAIDCHKSRLWCQITDTGVGIPKDKINTVFEPFSRIKEHASMASGSGFGMYVVKGLVDLLNGSIRITSEASKGTQVTLIVPIKIAEMERPDESAKRILLIDDDSSFLSLLEKLLQRLGHTVSACHTLDELEKELQASSSYDLVLTDMQMGPITGVDVLNRVNRYIPHIPVIVLTATADFTESQAKELGFYAYLKKPVSLSTLQSVTGGKQTVNMDSLNEMLDNDEEMIKEVLRAFVEAAEENVRNMKDAMQKEDIDRIALLAHKMIPMFEQIDEQHTSSILRKLEKYRGKAASELPGWEKEVETLLEDAGRLVQLIKEHYLNR